MPCRPKPREILAIAPNWLGDAVMFTPVLSELEKFSANLKVSIACRDYVAPIFKNAPCNPRIIKYPRKNLFSRIAAICKSKPDKGWIACLVAPPSLSAAILAAASGAAKRIGYGGGIRGIFLTDSMPHADYRRGHISEAYLGLLRRFSGASAKEIPLPIVRPDADWRDRVASICGDSPYAVIAPGATYGSAKVWPKEKYVGLARKLFENCGLKSVIVGSASERSFAESIAETAGHFALNTVGLLSIEELIAVLRGAKVAVGNDSGPAHIAAALGTPTVAIFGPTSIEWTAPRGKAVKVVSGKAPCAPCFLRKCKFQSSICLENISVEEVANTAMEIKEEKRD